VREIKFRGKRKSDGDLFYGDLVTETNGNFEVQRAFIHVRLLEINFTEDSLTSRIVIHEVEPETVGQFTGLKDKNDKEIWKGDRFKQKKSIGTIEYQDDSFIIDWDDPCPDNWNEHLRHHAKNGEVIGNIYDAEVTP
jgi:uncharacterized phage protein (TIGR01671 family)